jgi:type IV secretion system protein VirD4
MLVVFAIMMLGVWASTQWAASMPGYQAQLGVAWFQLASMPIYRLWQIFIWWYEYDVNAPHIFDKAGSLAAASGFLGCATAIGGSLWRAHQSRLVTTYSISVIN